MKYYLFSIFILLCSACSIHKSVSSIVSSKSVRIINIDKDTIIIKQDSSYIGLYTKGYLKQYQEFSNHKHNGNISNAIETNVQLSPASLQMIKEAGGMSSVFKRILSKENYEKYGGKVPLTLRVMLSLGDLEIHEYSITIYTKRIHDLSLNDKEVKKLYEFCKKMKFVYLGSEFKNEVVPAGWIFGINQ